MSQNKWNYSHNVKIDKNSSHVLYHMTTSQRSINKEFKKKKNLQIIHLDTTIGNAIIDEHLDVIGLIGRLPELHTNEDFS